MKEEGIRDLEQGRRKPSWETVLALAKNRAIAPLPTGWPPQ